MAVETNNEFRAVQLIAIPEADALFTLTEQMAVIQQIYPFTGWPGVEPDPPSGHGSRETSSIYHMTGRKLT